MSVAVVLDFSPRYYMPEVGRFIQEDPYPGLLSLPNSLVSKYVYTLNNPYVAGMRRATI